MYYGLYFHIPFCKRKCAYCDFLSYPVGDFSEDLIENYISSLKKEWDSKKISINNVDTIFIGGGTPSVINPKYIYDLLDYLRKDNIIDKDAEISIEVNPGTLTKEHFDIYKKSGINRISIGVQSTHNRLLKSLGRIHDYDEVVSAINDANNAGLENINCDLIFGIPGIMDSEPQTFIELQSDLNNILKLGVKHISTYSLILEEGTKFYDLYDDNKLKLVDDIEERKMYYYLRDFLLSNGFCHYEISNFALNGYESKHNLKYWDCSPYVGFGIGAASYFKSDNSEAYIRQRCESSINDYVNSNFIYDSEYISLDEQMNEFMMLGFRKIEGPDCDKFRNRFNMDYFDRYKDNLCDLKNRNLIKIDNNAKLSVRGLDFANEVFREFI